jgi:hypothetical protein
MLGHALSVPAVAVLGGANVPSWVVKPSNPLDLFIDFDNNLAWIKATKSIIAAASLLNVSRGSAATNLIYTDAPGAAYQTFASNQAVLKYGYGLGVFEGRTNYLLNSTAPITQTTGSLPTGTYTLWPNGPGTVTSSAGTATGTGFGTASNGTPNVFTLTGTGTVTATVSGSLNAFQLELNPGSVGLATPLIITAGSPVTRLADVITLANPPTFGSAFSMFAQGETIQPLNYTTSPRFVSYNDGTTSNTADLYIDRTTGRVSIGLTVGGTSQYQSTLSTTNYLGVMSKSAFALAAGSQAATVAGITPTTKTTSPIFLPTQINLGSRLTASQLNGFIAAIGLASSTAISGATEQNWTSGP